MSDLESRSFRHSAGAVLSVALLGATLWLAPAAGADDALLADSRYWNFRVLLDEREIGFHEFRVVDDGAAQHISTQARFDVKFLFFNAYRYRHENAETWQDGCLTGIRSTTDANGDKLELAGSLGNDGFVLDGAAGKQVLDSGCVRSFAYWDPSLLQAAALLNAQTGEMVPVEVRDLGPEILEIDTRVIPARRYRITMEDGAIDVWYHRETGRWLGLEAPTEGGRTLRYEPAGRSAGAESAGRLAMD